MRFVKLSEFLRFQGDERLLQEAEGIPELLLRLLAQMPWPPAQSILIISVPKIVGQTILLSKPSPARHLAGREVCPWTCRFTSFEIVPFIKYFFASLLTLLIMFITNMLMIRYIFIVIYGYLPGTELSASHTSSLLFLTTIII